MVNELEGIPNQGVLNRRLRKVFLNDAYITFVYNSCVRRCALESGLLMDNLAVQNAPGKSFLKDGGEVIRYFVRY